MNRDIVLGGSIVLAAVVLMATVLIHDANNLEALRYRNTLALSTPVTPARAPKVAAARPTRSAPSYEAYRLSNAAREAAVQAALAARFTLEASADDDATVAEQDAFATNEDFDFTPALLQDNDAATEVE